MLFKPTEFELRRKNQQFADKAKAGKRTVNPSRKEKLAKQGPINRWAIGFILFLIAGGGGFTSIIPANTGVTNISVSCVRACADSVSSLKLMWPCIPVYSSYLNYVRRKTTCEYSI
jgi:hypothetical protein